MPAMANVCNFEKDDLQTCLTNISQQIQEQKTEINNLHNELKEKITLMPVSRNAKDLITFTDATGNDHQLNLNDGTKEVKNDWIAYYPGNKEKDKDAELYFNLTGSPSIACTLLHADDDSLHSGKGFYFATEADDEFKEIWGKDTYTFALGRNSIESHVLARWSSYKIMCVK
jgi:hypothetical protein